MLKQLLGHQDAVLCVAVFPNGAKVVSVGADARIIIWNVFTGMRNHIIRCGERLKGNWLGEFTDRLQVAVAPSGNQVITCHTREKVASVWNTGFQWEHE